jgi:diguanylate cyclase (GGDEF)-like protein
MRQTITSSSRSGHYGALLFIDLDNFKNINDTRGHEFGDRVLVEAAKRILANVRAGDTVGRLGGDEFVVMLEDLSEESTSAATQTSLVGEKIRECLAQPFELDGAVAHSSASLGACLFHGHDVTEDALFRQADLAMYKAKSGGRNLLRFFDPLMQTALDERSAIEDDLRLALARGELQLYYQPQADHARRVLGAECLLRWLHPVRGQIPPIDFVPLAEDTGLIIAIGTWVLRIACAQLKAWAAAPETRQLQLAVNVSARQFQQPNFVDVVLQVLHETGADASRLKLELTESMLLGDVEVTINKMQSLQSHGITFSLDDFGTGFSSLSYLTRLPLCQLKIDRSFVLNLPENQNDSVVAQTIISMAQSLGMDVIAEGVETEAQRDFLERNHCKAYQGFLFSRPLSLEDFEALLKRNS